MGGSWRSVFRQLWITPEMSDSEEVRAPGQPIWHKGCSNCFEQSPLAGASGLVRRDTPASTRFEDKGFVQRSTEIPPVLRPAWGRAAAPIALLWRAESGGSEEGNGEERGQPCIRARTESEVSGRRDDPPLGLSWKVLVVNFWATWCPPCIAEIPHFVDLYRDYKDKGVQVVGVSMDFEADPDYIQEFCREAGMDYPIAKVKDYSEVQKIDRIWSAIEGIPTVDGLGEGEPQMGDGSVMMMPTTFIIDQDGYIFRKHIGPRERKDLEPEFLMLLKRGTEEAAPRS